MTHLIDKDALVAEIDRLDALYHLSKNLSGELFIEGLFCFLDAIEVKESTDAFIEKACEWLRCNYLKYPSEDCADTAKFVMDFKKYMK